MINNSNDFLSMENVEGERTKKKYTGRFTVKRYLVFKEKVDVARLNGVLGAGVTDDAMLDLISAYAHLAFHIVEAPKWWGDRGLDLEDTAPVWWLIDKVLELQKPTQEEEKVIEPAAEKKD
jgi:hypothetical protein